MWRDVEEVKYEAGLYFERAMTGNYKDRNRNLAIALYYLEQALPLKFKGISKLQDWKKDGHTRRKNKKKS